jgi:hypothetical protein
MMHPGTKISLSTFAFVAGLGILLMSASPFAEFMVYQKLVIPNNAAQTATNILAHQALFRAGILSYLFNFICDIVVAWALYGLLKPVNQSLSLLTAWFQLVYATISLVATINLVTVLRLLTTPDYLKVFGPDQLHTQVMLSLHAFRDGWSFGFFFFAFHLILLGYLVYRSGYIPKFAGICLVIAGLGYLVNTLQPFLFPNTDISYITITYFGELVFMLWLLIKGLKIREPNAEIS